MWNYNRTDWYLQGTLPVPVMSQAGDEVAFLPCNPAKQHLYADFAGYVLYPYNRERTKYAVTIRDGRFHMDKCPDAVLDVVPRLVEYARESGHTFPMDLIQGTVV